MRPRVFPAEDGSAAWAGAARNTGFNEAAGIPRGRLAIAKKLIEKGLRFNEAAGIPRGRREKLAVVCGLSKELQ